jgi:hypothetical protein
MDLSDKNTRAMLGYKLESQTNDEIDLKLLQTYLEATEKYGNTTVSIRYRALKLKYEALTTMPTMIEKTMSPAQLYASGSPLWANNYKGITVERILGKLYEEPKTEEDFNRALASVLGSKNNGRMMFDEYGNIGGIHGNLLQVALSQEHELQKIEQ